MPTREGAEVLENMYKVAMSKQVLTPSDVAEKLKVSAITVRVWCRRGLFPNATVTETPRGPYWEIPESDLEGFKPPKMGRPLKAKAETPKAGKKRGGKK